MILLRFFSKAMTEGWIPACAGMAEGDKFFKISLKFLLQLGGKWGKIVL